MKNEEIQNIKKIMGLQHAKDYTSTASLRYGRLMIMADQVCSFFLGRLICSNFPGSRRFAYQRPYYQLPRSFLSLAPQARRFPCRVCYAYCPSKWLYTARNSFPPS
jgi:hypothetical protein